MIGEQHSDLVGATLWPLIYSDQLTKQTTIDLHDDSSHLREEHTHERQ